jgi:hypothetical protein
MAIVMTGNKNRRDEVDVARDGTTAAKVVSVLVKGRGGS